MKKALMQYTYIITIKQGNAWIEERVDGDTLSIRYLNSNVFIPSMSREDKLTNMKSAVAELLEKVL